MCVACILLPQKKNSNDEKKKYTELVEVKKELCKVFDQMHPRDFNRIWGLNLFAFLASSIFFLVLSRTTSTTLIHFSSRVHVCDARKLCGLVTLALGRISICTDSLDDFDFSTRYDFILSVESSDIATTTHCHNNTSSALLLWRARRRLMSSPLLLNARIRF